MALLNIGAAKDTVIEARKSILDILRANCDENTKIVALNAFQTICNVENTTVQNCTFKGK